MKKKGKLKQIITFQEIIERLNKFWASQGCVVGQPYGLEVGAGTSNPHTFLRSLGPESFNVAYVEPSRRPNDGRYGQNPYRLQHYFQYQIILKPASQNNQELYLESLNALGIDTTKHDIRFVEDNWESPAIGAWGLGWEVWLDGMEITQYTYFQQVAGIPLEVPVLEITLGLERLAMYIQGVDDYRDIMLNEEVTYGDLFEKHEYWQSKHNYETADIKDLEEIYSLMRTQVSKQLEHGNYWAAYDYLLKISHLFNILDSRGVISVTDRISRFDIMGKLANRIGELYLDERKKLKYPMKNKVNPVEFKLSKEVGQKTTTVTKSNKLVLELYLEEMPADFARKWRDNYYGGEGVEAWLRELGLGFKSARVYWSGRRIVFEIEGCGDHGEVKKEVYGPVYDKAFVDGKINEAGKGFLKKHGAKEKDIVEIEKGGKKLLGIVSVEKYTLGNIMEVVIQNLFDIAPQSKKMTWFEGQGFGFIRPLRNILCFKDDKKINVGFWNVKSSGYIFCSRNYPKHTISIYSAQDYLQTVKKAGILVDESYREGLVREVVDFGKDRYDYSPNTEELIKLNTFLSEYPNTKFFTLDDKYSELPIELISKVLEENQKYIIRTLKEDSKHIEYGIVADKKGDASKIYQGNRKVVNGRLDDALFYWQRDNDVKLKSLRGDLKNIVFHPEVGSYREKVSRIKKLVEKILEKHTIDVNEKTLNQTLELIKNDKATSMVKEFASLEGIIGMYYAKREGYNDAVANLLYEHYLPTSEKSSIPKTEEGVLLSFADKLDNILVFSKIGGLPQGSSDPYEIRKNVYSLIKLLRDSKVDLDLYEMVESSEVRSFFNQRIYQIMKSECNLERVVKGIAYSNEGNISKKFEHLVEMKKVLSEKEVEDRVFDTLKRIYNILEKADIKSARIGEDLLQTKSERDLYDFVKKFEKKKISVQNLLEVSNLLENFFEETMVNVENKNLKQNRLLLLMKLRDLLGYIVVI